MESPKPHRPDLPAPRRVATAPIPSSALEVDNPAPHSFVETLYNHPNAKIISFTASGRAFARSRSRNSDAPGEEEPGTLSWSSQLERTIAVGPFRIYRATGSVAFLSCGSALQPILPKSQCWCLDEVNSKFVLQIRRPNYWRIELPVFDPEDQQRAQVLRGVMDKVLQFEKTECPFKRSFTVVLPERPQTPVRKKPWTPVRRTLPADATDDPESPLSRPSTATSPVPAPRPIWGSTGAEAATHRGLTRPRSYSSKSYLNLQVENVEEVENERDVNNKKSIPQRRVSLVEHDKGSVTDSFRSRLTLFEQGCSSSNFLQPAISSLGFQKNNHLAVPNEPVRQDRGGETPIHEDGDEGALDTGIATQSVAEDADSLAYELHEGTGHHSDQRKSRLRRRVGRSIARSASTPLLTPSAASSQPLDPLMETPPSELSQSVSSTESRDSFHSVESWHSSSARLSSSPGTSQAGSSATFPYPHDNVKRPKYANRNRGDVGKMEISEPRSAWDAVSREESEISHESVATAPDLPTAAVNSTNLTSIIPEGKSEASTSVVSHQRPAISRRATTSGFSIRQRALSPLPFAINLFSSSSMREQRPPSRSRLETVKQLPLTIISKTCEMIIGPPSHLIALMLKVAAKIASGQWRGIVYGYSEDGETIPVRWDYSEGDFSDCSDDEPYMDTHRERSSGSKDDIAQINTDRSGALDDSKIWGVD